MNYPTSFTCNAMQMMYFMFAYIRPYKCTLCVGLGLTGCRRPRALLLVLFSLYIFCYMCNTYSCWILLYGGVLMGFANAVSCRLERRWWQQLRPVPPTPINFTRKFLGVLNTKLKLNICCICVSVNVSLELFRGD